MRDLIEELSTAFNVAINEARTGVEEAQREFSERLAIVQAGMSQAIAEAHMAFAVASAVRMEEANKDMAAQITAFLGQLKPHRLPDEADGPLVVTHVEDYSEAAQ